MDKYCEMIHIPSNIKNIIFDLGGVILDIDPESTIKAFGKLGFKKPADNLMNEDFKKFLFDFETGYILKKDFYVKISEFSSQNPGKKELYDAWNLMISGYKQEKIDFLNKIKTEYRTFLLSNTNIIHAEYYNNLLKSKHGVEDLTFLFEKVYYSHEIMLRKPNAEAYNIVLNENNLVPGETLFVDDTEINVIAAEKLGIVGIIYEEISN